MTYPQPIASAPLYEGVSYSPYNMVKFTKTGRKVYSYYHTSPSQLGVPTQISYVNSINPNNVFKNYKAATKKTVIKSFEYDLRKLN